MFNIFDPRRFLTRNVVSLRKIIRHNVETTWNRCELEILHTSVTMDYVDFPDL